MADDDDGYDLTIWMVKNLWLEGWWWWWWFNNLNSNPRLGIEHGWRGEKSDMKHRGVWSIHCTRDGDDDDSWWWWWLFCWRWSMMIVLFMMTMTEDVVGDKKYQVWGFRKFCECFLWHLRPSSPIQGVKYSIHIWYTCWWVTLVLNDDDDKLTTQMIIHRALRKPCRLWYSTLSTQLQVTK